MKKLFSLLSFMFFLVLLGCATPVSLNQANSVIHKDHYPLPSDTVDDGKGLVFIYEEGERFLPDLITAAHVTANGKRVGIISNGSYFVYAANPGVVVFDCEREVSSSIDDYKGSRSLRVEAGKRYYLRFTLMPRTIYVDGRFEIVPEEEGKQAIKNLTYVTMK